ncbi:MAG: glycoside hydrolase family 88/105 protein [Microbacter sp.]
MTKRLVAFLFIANIGLMLFAAEKGEFSYLSIASKVALSDIQRNPEAWRIDFNQTPKWDYCQGLMVTALLKLYDETSDTLFYHYVKRFADFMIDSMGNVRTYQINEFSLDRVNGGKFLMVLYRKTHQQNYLKAIQQFRYQLLLQPRTSDSGFWHKAVYPHQMWLDGAYMASPFLAQYGRMFNDTTALSEAIRQLLLLAKHTYDPLTGLYYHAWDESRNQRWANKITGQSPNFWSRSMGWYMMALVDVLDFVPDHNPHRKELISIFRRLTNALLKYQDPSTGLWYQVTDRIGSKGNYLESSSTAMFMYAITKGFNKGYLDRHFLDVAKTTFQQFLRYAVVKEQNGSYTIRKACAVAGLGGNPYRDGSYQYYISEPQRDNDPKVIAPFLMWAIQLYKASY